jgi:uncharacterized membrane protein YgcG
MSDDPLGPDLTARLKAELDRVEPRHTSPRYLSSPMRPLTFRLAPALLAASVIGILALSAFVATGSPNPVVWGERVVTVLQPGAPSSDDDHTVPGATPSHSPERESPEPTETAEPQETPGGEGSSESGSSPEPAQSAEPSDTTSGEGSSGGSSESGSGETSSDSSGAERS